MGSSSPNPDLREHPPRYLSLFTQLSVFFGGTYFQGGSVFFWFGMIFVIAFGGQSELKHIFSFDKHVPRYG